MRDVVTTLGLDLSDDSLTETPHRIAKMYVDEVFAGLDYSQFPKIAVIDNKMGVDEMVKISDISLTSTCEHHFVTIDGVADVAYIPHQKIIGLSKINRIVRFFAQRPQVQERMTQQSNTEGLSEEEAQERFMDAVGRMAPLTGTKLGLVGSIQHLHLLPEYHDRLEKAGFDVTIPIGGARLSFPGQVLGCNYSGDDPSIGHYLF